MVLSRRLQVTNKKYGKIKLLWQENYPDGVLGSAISDDGSVLYVSCYDRTRVFTRGGDEQNCFETDGFLQSSTTGSGKYTVITTLSKVLLISPKGYKTITEKQNISTARISSQGELIAVGIGKVVECFNLRGEPLWEHDVKEKIWGIAIAREAKKIAVGTGKEVYCFDFFGKLEWRYRTGNLISDIEISADGELITASSGKMLYLFSKRGQVLWSKEVGTVKCLSASDDFELIALGHSTKAIAYNKEGNVLFDHTAKDFINSIAVSPGGETVVAGTGSEIFSKSELYCFERHGEILWRYDAKGNINVVTTTKNGEFVAMGDSKRMYLFDNMMIASFTSIKLTESVETKLQALEKLGLKLEKERSLLKEARQKEKKTPLEALNLITRLDKDITALYNKYEQGRKKIPDWIKTLGLTMQVSAENINEILPIFAEYQDLKTSEQVQHVSATLIQEMVLIHNIMDAINKDKIAKMRSSKAVTILKTRMLEAMGAYNALEYEKKQLEGLHGKRVQFLMNLEDQIRTIFLDIISKRSYKRKLSQLAGTCDEFSGAYKRVVSDIEQRVESIAEWIKHDSDFPEDTGVYIEHDIVSHQESLQHHILVENNYDYDLKDLEIWCFANRSELQLLPQTSPTIFIDTIPKNSTKKLSFSYKFFNRPVSGIHGYIAFSPPRELLDTFSGGAEAPELKDGATVEAAAKQGSDETISKEALTELLKLEKTLKQCFSAPKAILGKLGIKREKGLGPETLTITDEELARVKGQLEGADSSGASSTKYLKFSIGDVPGPQFFIMPNKITQADYSALMDSELNKPWQRAIDLRETNLGKVTKFIKDHCSQFHIVKESGVKTKKGKAFVYWLSGVSRENVRALLTIIIRQRKKDVEVGFSSFSDDREYAAVIPQALITELKGRFQS